jgi:CheY-like chemotaxis protein
MSGTLEGRHILVVEDEMLVLMNIESALTDLGCNASSTGTVAGALQLIDNANFDAAMLDVNLQGENSYSVADALVALGIPFLFSTGYDHHETRSDLASRPVLRKPYAHASLVAALTALVVPSDKMS